MFRPRDDRLFGPGPVFLYAGRVSKEKNIEAFLTSELPGKKVVVGDGPHLSTLRRAHPDAIYTGLKRGEDLARHYASADVFVFPSRTDTFGLVLLEALASGLPVAAYPVTGPVDIIEHGHSGFLDNDLTTAALGALLLDRRAARQRALAFSWGETARLFIDNIKTAHASAVHNTAPSPRQTKDARIDSTMRRTISGGLA
jgi:glycosyltransferase involved in cell wall biosynthesis